MLKKIIKYGVAGLVAAYILFAMIIIPNLHNDKRCKGVFITVHNDENGNLSRENVIEILQTHGLDPLDIPVDSIMCLEIENHIKGISLVKNCEVYKTTTGYIDITIDCRVPILKVHNTYGESYYIDSKANKITGVHKALFLPVASGYITEEIKDNDLKEIANAIHESSFWRAQTEQVYFDEQGKVTLVPRVGDHIIEFGTAENAKEKLEKLFTFYKKGLATVGWEKYEVLNIEFNDKVIGTKKNKKK